MLKKGLCVLCAVSMLSACALTKADQSANVPPASKKEVIEGRMEKEYDQLRQEKIAEAESLVADYRQEKMADAKKNTEEFRKQKVNEAELAIEQFRQQQMLAVNAAVDGYNAKKVEEAEATVKEFQQKQQNDVEEALNEYTSQMLEEAEAVRAAASKLHQIQASKLEKKVVVKKAQ